MNITKSKLIVTAISALALASVVSTAKANTAQAPAQHLAVTVDSQGRSFVGGLDIAQYLTADQLADAHRASESSNGICNTNYKCQKQ
jgi:biopolymer transport protein ExbD